MSDQPYQLLPPLTAEEYASLREDIAANGIRVPVDVDEDGRVLDGHHRQAIADELDIECPTRIVPGLTETDKRAHALSVNLQRRALTREQRRGLITVELNRDPDRSDRAIGRLIGVDHKTVGALRRELEEAKAGEHAHLINELIEAAWQDLTTSNQADRIGYAFWVLVHWRDAVAKIATGDIPLREAVRDLITRTGCSQRCRHVAAAAPLRLPVPSGEFPHHEAPFGTLGPYKVHPVLDLFPWVDDDLFGEIIDSIKRDGLLRPIVLTADESTMVDGRIRYLACEAAGVEPAYTTLPATYTEEDLAAYVFSVNGFRTYLSPDERAALHVLAEATR